ncbi:MAG: hypothetical protein US50_C0051G0008 [Candidatus Nomurabacteria bacterium GW2011_GWB1_37_5]|uniref:Uncharacterized protein n=1 Tax=Candidatus Nomurabacteria bacterium GW2011_GWB1_37_5 TaxID=1618742 RepID=A0A0G0H758_9BACT|nr:MAG: hypothetical protein US50_C0051G0008 [Candidatus Nomurabacteria bacterium GW2011_GWB1_37_5]
MQNKTLKKIVVLIIFIFIVNTLAMKFHWYYTFWWFDLVMHFLGGFWVGLSALWLIFLRFKVINSLFLERLLPIFIVSFLSVLLVGILWEFFEISIDTLITFNPQDLTDTLSDLVMDLIGSFVASMYFIFKINNNKV